jgi:hypothetical protein
MFVFVHWLIGLNLMRAKVFNLKQMSLAYIGFMLLNTIVMHLLYLASTNFQFLIIIAVLLILITEFMARKKGSMPKSTKFLKLALVGIVIAESFSLLDLTRVMCNPENHFIQGHAIWHVTSSIALFFGFTYFVQFDQEIAQYE